MRLDKKVVAKIVDYAKRYFGANFKLYLFGSRVYDYKKGGDIDLFVESETSISKKTQFSFLADIYKNVTERKIDLVVKTPEKENRPIFETAKKEGVVLC